MSNSKHIVIVGGGAAGLAAAIAAARAGAHVVVLEAGMRVGQKILKTGNGRCNLTNAHVGPTDYNNPGFVAPIIDAYPAARVLDFFEELGMLCSEEAEGRIYPLSNSANTVLDVLRNACERLGIETLYGHEAIALRHFGRSVESAESRNLTVECSNGTMLDADAIVVATGGGTKLLESAGHALAPFKPVLCPLKTDTKPLKGLDGVRAHATVRAFRDGANEPIAKLSGEVLFRSYGLSGIVIFDMSRIVSEGDWLSLDFLPQYEEDVRASILNGIYESLCMCAAEEDERQLSYADLMCGLLHTRLNNAVLRAAGCKPSAPVDPSKIPAIAKASKDFRVRVMGPGDARQAQVTRGGAILEEFNPETLESGLCPGLYAAGETLDIDGRCGGFNLHWAWASGIKAGTEAASS